MLSLPLIALAVGVLGSAPVVSLPQGNEHFRLGMSHAQVDSAVAQRGLRVISDGTAYLVCASDDEAIEYEQYSFFQIPHGKDILWKVTLGYRLDVSIVDYALVRERLKSQLGEPAADSWVARPAPAPGDPKPEPTSQRAVWADEHTAVQIGARWTGAPDANADRMMVSWVDRRLQRLIDARHKKEKAPRPQ